MPDVVIAQPAIKSTPAAYLVAGAQAFELLSVQASYDGSAAAGAFLPALQLVDPGGHVMATATATSVAAGASAAVTWFPGVGAPAAADTDTWTVLDEQTVAADGTISTITIPATGQIPIRIPGPPTTSYRTLVLVVVLSCDTGGTAPMTMNVGNGGGFPGGFWYQSFKNYVQDATDIGGSLVTIPNLVIFGAASPTSRFWGKAVFTWPDTGRGGTPPIVGSGGAQSFFWTGAAADVFTGMDILTGAAAANIGGGPDKIVLDIGAKQFRRGSTTTLYGVI